MRFDVATKKKILIPMDGSKSAIRALRFAAKTFDAVLLVLNVQPEMPSGRRVLLCDRDGQPRPRAHRSPHVGIGGYEGDLPGRVPGHYREVARRPARDRPRRGQSIA
jgi:hypothetical protein